MKARDMKESAEETERTWISEFGPYLTMGMQLAIAVVAFFFLGRWLDSVLNTAPWLMITGLIVGTAGGFVSFFRSVIAMGKKENKLKKSTDGGRESR